MRGPPAALLLFLLSAAGCTGPVALLLDNPIAIDHLDGNYQVIASCAYERLSRQYPQLSRTERREQRTVSIASTTSPLWKMSFTDEDGGRQTRLEIPSGTYPGEHILAVARACGA